MTGPAVDVREVSLSYGPVAALNSVSFRVSPGTMLGLLGRNGSGKSTLLRLLTTLIPLQSGDIFLNGSSIRHQPEMARQKLGVVFQSPALDPRLTVAENLNCHGRLYGMNRRQCEQRAGQLLSEFRISQLSRRFVSTLSGGERRRAELVKGLMPSPEVLVMDEPTSGLDPSAREEFWALVHAQRESSGTTIVVATHLMDEAMQCQQLVFLERGRVAGGGLVPDLLAPADGDRLLIRLRDPEIHQSRVDAMLQVRTERTAAGVVGLVKDAAGKVSQLWTELSDCVLSVELCRATLDDVFRRMTGHSLHDEDDADV
jgi:ABC-2 type transport system ATP-binding protein